MKVAFTHNLRLTDVRETEKEAEYDSAETVNAIAAALEAAGHEVEKVEVSGPASNLLERLEAIDPDIIFNTAEGDRGRMREAFYPALFEELGIPYTGSRRVHERDHARQVAHQARSCSAPASTPRAACSSRSRNFEHDDRARRRARVPGDRQAEPRGLEQGHLQRRSLGSSVVKEPRDLRAALKARCARTPTACSSRSTSTALDVAVGFIEGVGHDDGLLTPVEMI